MSSIRSLLCASTLFSSPIKLEEGVAVLWLVIIPLAHTLFVFSLLNFLHLSSMDVAIAWCYRFY